MTAFQLLAGAWALPILSIGVAGFVGSMVVAWWAGRHKDADLDPETEARIWARVKAAVDEDRTRP